MICPPFARASRASTRALSDRAVIPETDQKRPAIARTREGRAFSWYNRPHFTAVSRSRRPWSMRSHRMTCHQTGPPGQVLQRPIQTAVLRPTLEQFAGFGMLGCDGHLCFSVAQVDVKGKPVTAGYQLFHDRMFSVDHAVSRVRRHTRGVSRRVDEITWLLPARRGQSSHSDYTAVFPGRFHCP